jgi:hypothetical protein
LRVCSSIKAIPGELCQLSNSAKRPDGNRRTARLRRAGVFLAFGGLRKVVRPEISRKAIYRLSVYGMEKLGRIIARRQVKMAMVTVPAGAAQEVADTLIAFGITGILNFAPLVLRVPAPVVVNNINLAMELENLSCFVQR